MRGIERNYLVYIAVVEVTLHVLAGNYTAHAVTDEDVAGRQLTIEVGIMADGIKGFLAI